MAEIIVKIGADGTWAVPGTDQDLSSTNVNQYYQAMAISMNLAAGFGERIRAQADSVAADTTMLQQMNTALSTGWQPSDWDALSITEKKARSDAMALVDPGSIYGDTVQINLQPPATSPVFVSPNFPTEDSLPPIGQGSSPFFYFAGFGETYLFYDAPDGSRTIIDPSQISEPFQAAAPDQGTIDGIAPRFKDAVQNLTQVSQGKQAFLQDLMASMSKFLDLATNLVQRDERNRQDIIGRF
ncbi:MAG: hypothetical protein EOO28_16360 [Comamonadaceae bacterium]|nr:MAG: hypothetical protein EOO28_16360 [Comamonadaceae bacterium]